MNLLKIKYAHCIFLAFILVTAFVSSTDLIDNPMSKMFYFYLVSILSISMSIFLLFFVRKPLTINLNILDFALLAYICYNFIRLVLTDNIPVINDRALILLFLTYFYFSVKFVSSKLSIIKTSPFFIVIITLLIVGTAQAVLGILQAHNLFGFHSAYFLTVGTLGNPSYYSGFLTAIFPLSFGLYLYTEPGTLNQKFIKYSSQICFLTILFVLPLTKIRGDWFACAIAAIFIIYHKYGLLKHFESITKRLISLSMSLLLGGVILFGLYNIRPASAFGRLLIWKVSANIISDYPLFGAGFNRYGQIYNNYQADYFAAEDRSKFEKYVADNVRHAHNEYIQHFAELGVPGILLIITLLYLAILKSKSCQFERLSDVDTKNIIFPVKASLIAISVSAFFAFPFQILPNLINSILLLGIISGIGLKNKWVINLNKHVTTKIIGFCCFILVSWLTVKLVEEFFANNKWRVAYNLSTMMLYNEALTNYEALFPLLKGNPDFLLNYGGTLALAGCHERAVKVLESGKNICSATSLYISLGNSYKALGNYSKAEANYIKASEIVPNRFYPKYLLVKLYLDWCKKREAKLLAESILQMPVKVNSTAVNQIKQEMKAILNCL